MRKLHCPRRAAADTMTSAPRALLLYKDSNTSQDTKKVLSETFKSAANSPLITHRVNSATMNSSVSEIKEQFQLTSLPINLMRILCGNFLNRINFNCGQAKTLIGL